MFGLLSIYFYALLFTLAVRYSAFVRLFVCSPLLVLVGELRARAHSFSLSLCLFFLFIVFVAYPPFFRLHNFII